MRRTFPRRGTALVLVVVLAMACSSTPQAIVTGDNVAVESLPAAPTIEWLLGTAWTIVSPTQDAGATVGFSSVDGDVIIHAEFTCLSRAWAKPVAERTSEEIVLQIEVSEWEGCESPTDFRERLFSGTEEDLRLSLTDDGLLRIVTEAGEEFLAEHTQSDSANSGSDLGADRLRSWLTVSYWVISEMHGFDPSNDMEAPGSNLNLYFGDTNVRFQPCHNAQNTIEWIDGGFRDLGWPDGYFVATQACPTSMLFDDLAAKGEVVEVTVTEGRLELRSGDRLVVAVRDAGQTALGQEPAVVDQGVNLRP